MSEEAIQDDQSHYEVSLTAGQAFVAFVFLLLSLAASFAFGLMMGRGQGEDRLVVKREPAVVTEASAVPKKSTGRIVELGVADDAFKAPAAEAAAQPAESQPVVEEAAPQAAAAAPNAEPAPTAGSQPAAVPPATAASPAGGPAFAQLLSTADQKTAEALATKLIERGFNSAYVERGATEKGTIFRVRVKFASEQEARAAETRLREFSKDVWITR
ncbi:MAG TPA: SPOR domain-containing protein [Thermoanaerobaculia bacterium]|nr:SPOR domain-containing protein [Thermoanaerobaculia bacterium]